VLIGEDLMEFDAATRVVSHANGSIALPVAT
jgi:hypothetical protein